MFENVCDKCIDGRAGKVVNSRSSSWIPFIQEHERKITSKPRCI